MKNGIHAVKHGRFTANKPMAGSPAASSLSANRVSRSLARRRAFLALGLVGALGACGGGGSSAPEVVPVPVTVLGMSNPVASQGASGEAMLSFRTSPSSDATFPLEISFTVSGAAAGASCSAGVDYYVPAQDGVGAGVATDGTVKGKLTIGSATANRVVKVAVCPGNSAADRTLQFAWSGGGAQNTATGTIRGSASLAIGLNDTGITNCGNATQNGLACPVSGFELQDGAQGRDANAAVTGAGASRQSAFLLTTLSGGCIQDNVSGLVWEAKSTDGGLHDTSRRYAWADAADYVAQVNAEKHCGFSDWRLPTVLELTAIVDNGASAAPTIDPRFAGQAAVSYRTAAEKAGDANGAWLVDFSSGAVVSDSKLTTAAIRLVRGR